MPALALVLALAACGGVERRVANPARLTLVNRTGETVHGAVLRFDRELTRVEHLGRRGFAQARLRLSPADTLRLGEGELRHGEDTRYRVTGADGPPVFLDGRWLIEGKVGPPITQDEISLR